MLKNKHLFDARLARIIHDLFPEFGQHAISVDLDDDESHRGWVYIFTSDTELAENELVLCTPSFIWKDGVSGVFDVFAVFELVSPRMPQTVSKLDDELNTKLFELQQEELSGKISKDEAFQEFLRLRHEYEIRQGLFLEHRFREFIRDTIAIPLIQSAVATHPRLELRLEFYTQWLEKVREHNQRAIVQDPVRLEAHELVMDLRHEHIELLTRGTANENEVWARVQPMFIDLLKRHGIPVPDILTSKDEARSI